MNEIKVIDMRVAAGDGSFMIDDGETAILVDAGFGFTGPALAKKRKEYLIIQEHPHG